MPSVSRTNVEIWKTRFRRLYTPNVPLAQPAPLLNWVPPTAGSTFTVTHSLSLWNPIVQVTLYAVNHTLFAATPTNRTAAITGAHRLAESEFDVATINALAVNLSLPWALVNNPSDAHDYRLLSVDVFPPGVQPGVQLSGPAQLAALADTWAADAAETVTFTGATIEGGSGTGVVTGSRLELLAAAEELLADPMFLAGINTPLPRTIQPDFSLCRP